jgi:NAD(P)-dependent dehydrogenase (short-subunit alcohol dehydrogenase family)
MHDPETATAAVVLVTGAASGIGRAVARRFHAAGWRVYATDVDADGLAPLADRGMATLPLDVTDDDATRAAVDRIRDEAGRIDCLVNNAGVGTAGTVEDVPPDRARRTFEVNALGPHRVTRAVLPGMRERGEGRIVTVSSVLGRTVPPGLGVYAASKHAVEALTDALRREVGPLGVDVVAVQPAWVATAFADRARGAAPGPDAGADRTSDYDAVYALDDQLDFLGGGPLAVSPARVARTVHRAATDADPRARYPVGLAARTLVATRWLPDAVVDGGFRLLARVASAVDRHREG